MVSACKMTATGTVNLNMKPLVQLIPICVSSPRLRTLNRLRPENLLLLVRLKQRKRYDLR